jgi:hypothetical protein
MKAMYALVVIYLILWAVTKDIDRVPVKMVKNNQEVLLNEQVR